MDPQQQQDKGKGAKDDGKAPGKGVKGPPGPAQADKGKGPNGDKGGQPKGKDGAPPGLNPQAQAFQPQVPGFDLQATKCPRASSRLPSRTHPRVSNSKEPKPVRFSHRHNSSLHRHRLRPQGHRPKGLRSNHHRPQGRLSSPQGFSSRKWI